MFALLAIALLGGIGVGLLTGGRLDGLKEISLRFGSVLFVALILGLLPLFVKLPDGVRVALLVGSMLGVLLFLALTLRSNRAGVRMGFAVIASGWLLNFIVIAANRGMPLSVWALAQSGQSGGLTPGTGDFFKIEIAGPGTLLRFLGDVIPIRVVSQVVSIGDLVLMLGIGIVLAAGMHARADTSSEVAATQPLSMSDEYDPR